MTENGVRLMDRNYVSSQNPLRIQLERVRERKEKREQEIKKVAERLAKEELARVAAYNEPLPDFPSKVPPDVRRKLIGYVASVIHDAVGQPGYLPTPPEKVSVALRIVLLMTGKTRSFFYVILEDESVEQTSSFWLKVSNRLERNLLKHFPLFKPLTEHGSILFDGWYLDGDLGKLKKKGFLQLGEKRVLHLEFMEGKDV